MEWKPGGSHAWLRYDEVLARGYRIYACKRPDHYDYRSQGYPWAHIYVMHGEIRDSGIIETHSFADFAPLEMECALIAIREKYST
jgi:hypothetical protein